MLQLRYEQSILKVITILLCLFSELKLWILQNQGSSFIYQSRCTFSPIGVCAEQCTPFWPFYKYAGPIWIHRAHDQALYEFDLHCSFL